MKSFLAQFPSLSLEDNTTGTPKSGRSYCYNHHDDEGSHQDLNHDVSSSSFGSDDAVSPTSVMDHYQKHGNTASKTTQGNQEDFSSSLPMGIEWELLHAQATAVPPTLFRVTSCNSLRHPLPTSPGATRIRASSSSVPPARPNDPVAQQLWSMVS